MCYGQPLNGVETAPDVFRRRGLEGKVRALGYEFVDRGNAGIPLPAPGSAGSPSMRNAESVGAGNASIHSLVRRPAEGGEFIATCGGDHSVAVGSVSALLAARPDLGIVWVDAHADINTPDTSGSGNLHGMPVALLTRLVDPARVPGHAWLTDAARGIPALDPRRLVYVGLRDVDAGEKRLVRSLGILAFTMTDIDRMGIGAVMARALDHLQAHAHAHPASVSTLRPAAAAAGAAGAGGSRGRAPGFLQVRVGTSAGAAPGPRPLHLSFDIDAVDPAVAPSTGTAVPGGLSYREAHYVCEACAETGGLGSMDLVEVNPCLGAGEAAEIAAATATAQRTALAAGAATTAPRSAAYDEATAAAAAASVTPAGAATVDVALRLLCSALGQTILPPPTPTAV